MHRETLSKNFHISQTVIGHPRNLYTKNLMSLTITIDQTISKTGIFEIMFF